MVNEDHISDGINNGWVLMNTQLEMTWQTWDYDITTLDTSRSTYFDFLLGLPSSPSKIAALVIDYRNFLENSSSNGEVKMKTSVILALFGFVLPVGFSVAVTENELAEITDEFEAGKLRG
ncbi:hypothetical protein pdam_00024919 [Pocillopora damicornis]|uniref:Uncharacterized protein n=1 Tax=Pocillopora damicornis TaxID=46731 RepID=A0A3M6TE40_POCDA|nr:hypothetical protein pdam_00024919 [Pocillopora damicornis]